MKTLFILAIISFNSFAFTPEMADKEGLLYFQKFDVQDADNTVIVEEDKGQLGLSVYSQDKKKLFSFSMASTEFFQSAQVVSVNKYSANTLLTIWNKGAHGKQLLIHDLTTGKELLHIKSSFTLDYLVSADDVTINWTGDMQKDPTPKKEKTIWPKK